MNHRALFFAFLLIPFSILFSQEHTSLDFPNDFFGAYSGTLEISSEKGTRSIGMEFYLQPTDSLGKYEYKLVYLAAGNRQERAYHLLEQDKEAGTYIVDEHNGIILDDKVIGNKMYTFFEVNNTLLTTFITFEKDHLVFEIVAANTGDKRTTSPDDDPDTKVFSYPISTVQRAVLQKQ